MQMENGCKTKQMENGFRIVLAGGIDMLMEHIQRMAGQR